MLKAVTTVTKRIDDYRLIVDGSTLTELKSLAKPLRGARVLHINATPRGGGVAEILNALVPLMNDLGMHTEWRVIKGNNEFFKVTKTMHNGLQGMTTEWNTNMEHRWLICNDMNAELSELFEQCYDFVIVHDPQPVGILGGVLKRNGHHPLGTWLWQCHIETSNAKQQIWDMIHPFVSMYHGIIFTQKKYINGRLNDSPGTFTIWPAIDPLNPKNRTPDADVIQRTLSKYGLDSNRPIICQISRYDPWKDPVGVVDVYREVKKKIPELQLVIVGNTADDDPEGEHYYQLTVQRAGQDDDIHILRNLDDNDVEVGAFQQAADVIIQKSTREGFGLTVTEALWKGRPVVAGNVGGITLQIQHGETGYLANTLSEYVTYVSYLLQNPQKASEMGRKGKEYANNNLLITRCLCDYLRVFNKFNH